MPIRLGVAGGTLAALGAGGSRATGDDGPPLAVPVLCVPGFTGSKEDFAPLLPLLAGAGFRAVAIDLRGQYESVWDEQDSSYRRDELAADVAELVRQLDRPHLVAHSYGGIVARAALIAGTRPRSLTLLGSGPAGILGNRRVLIEAMKPILAEGGVAAVWAAAESLTADDPAAAAVPADVQEFLRRRFLASSPVGLRVMGDDLRCEPDRVEELAGVLADTAIPALVAHGEADDAWPPAVQRTMAERLGAAYAVIPDALHSPAVEAPEATAAVLLRFWQASAAEFALQSSGSAGTPGGSKPNT